MMKLKAYSTFLLLFFVLSFFQVGIADAEGPCLCVDYTNTAQCIPASDRASCETNYNCSKAQWEGTNADCDKAMQNLNNTTVPYVAPASSGGQTKPPTPVTPPGTQTKSTLAQLISDCGQPKMPPQCYDITVFISLAIQIIDYLFGIIGGVALLFFVYGGFVMILSQGNAERVGHGKSVIVAAVLGIIIAFSGYAIVKFVGDVVGIKGEYTLY